MKKILLLIITIVTIFSLFNTMSFADDCSFDVDSKNGGSISSALNKCLDGVDLVNVSDAKVDGNFGTQIKSWTNNIALYLGIFAVGSIVFGGLMMTLSAGEEEKIKKAKDIVKWGIIGFIGLITASAIINLVVKIMYSI